MSDLFDPSVVPTFNASDFTFTPGVVTPPTPWMGSSSPGAGIPGFMATGALNTGNGATSALTSAALSPYAPIFLGLAGLLAVVVMLPDGSRRR